MLHLLIEFFCLGAKLECQQVKFTIGQCNTYGDKEFPMGLTLAILALVTLDE